jgi:hypothetical protein
MTCLRIRWLNSAAARFLVFAVSADGHERQVDPQDHGNLETRLEPLRDPIAAENPDTPAAGSPEAWLESRVRAGIEALDAGLLPAPVYGQVPQFAGGDRGILDLLAADRRGQLAVLELKATADPQLPIQALDYWMRVKWHQDHGEFTRLGYFPGLPLAALAPRLLLVAPALEFHPTSETILRYFSPDIPVERFGLGMNWRRDFLVAFRIAGARRPGIA